MSVLPDETHASQLTSWVEGADGHPDFPIQNLPLCIFSTAESPPRAGVAIGPMLLDLAAVADAGLVGGEDARILRTAAGRTLNSFFAMSAAQRLRFRHILSQLLCAGADPPPMLREAVVDAATARLHLPVDVGDYSDFFAGIHHAATAGRMFRPDNPLLPNYKHVPIAYHGRSSSVCVSGHPVVRPVGQRAAHGATEPDYGASNRLDYELELAIWVRGGNALGTTIPIERAGAEIVGFGLLNDWSARDIQAWETQPLGPFLGKNFLTTVSPFVVTAEALAPFRSPQPPRAQGDPAPLPYLQDAEDQSHGAFDIQLEVLLRTAEMRRSGLAPHRLARSSGLDLYWTPAQMIAHHSSNGCNLRPGDLFGSGTVSGPGPDGHGSLLELTSGGRNPAVLPNGETRTFLEDGDEVILTGWCEREGFARIGLGEAKGLVVTRG
ncbi:fumarylacetoacetase [Phenylobacterium sp.]|uniref:fumarylacetoacetase n=1 Tax=Phenylobacterium sp. TaxID=1871053 RepID=UPI002FE18250